MPLGDRRFLRDPVPDASASWRASGLRPGDELRLTTLPFFDEHYRVWSGGGPLSPRGRPRPCRAFGHDAPCTHLRACAGGCSSGSSGRSQETPLEVARRHVWQQAMWRVDRVGNCESACTFGCVTVGRQVAHFGATRRGRKIVVMWAIGRSLRCPPKRLPRGFAPAVAVPIRMETSSHGGSAAPSGASEPPLVATAPSFGSVPVAASNQTPCAELRLCAGEAGALGPSGPRRLQPEPLLGAAPAWAFGSMRTASVALRRCKRARCPRAWLGKTSMSGQSPWEHRAHERGNTRVAQRTPWWSKTLRSGEGRKVAQQCVDADWSNDERVRSAVNRGNSGDAARLPSEGNAP